MKIIGSIRLETGFRYIDVWRLFAVFVEW